MRVTTDGGPLVGALQQPVLVDGVAEGVPELRVLECGVAVTDRLVGLGVDGPGVEPELLEVRRDAVERLDALAALECLDLQRGDVVDEVHLALDQRLDHRVLGLEHPDDHLVDVRLAAPVVRVLLEPVRRATGLALHEHERTGAHDRLPLGSARPGRWRSPSRRRSSRCAPGGSGSAAAAAPALGFLSFSTTVVSSGAVAVSTFVR